MVLYVLLKEGEEEVSEEKILNNKNIIDRNKKIEELNKEVSKEDK